MAELQDSLPPGWDCKLDAITGKSYYINHFTKTTTWDDPRTRHRPLSATPKYFNSSNTEHIPLQHGSPDLRRNYVYPSQTSPIPAFQMPPHQSPKSNPLQEFRSVSRMSPLTLRSSKIQDSSLSVFAETEEAIGKLSAMFPTVSDTHIRMLMKNYRYMKSIFPEAEELMLLEILSNNENNIQKSSDILKDMGFQKKDTVKAAQQKLEAKIEVEQAEAEHKIEEVAIVVPKIKSGAEKTAVKDKLSTLYKDVADHLITMALESVDFDENRANQILQIVVQEDTGKNKQVVKPEISEEIVVDMDSNKSTSMSISQSRQSIKSVMKNEKIDKDKNVFVRVVEKSNIGYKSSQLSNTNGADPDLAQGANDKLLLSEYVNWQGPKRSLRNGPQHGLTKGPNHALLCNRSYQPCGSNADLCTGPKFGLAKGSIFNQLKRIVIGESRGN